MTDLSNNVLNSSFFKKLTMYSDHHEMAQLLRRETNCFEPPRSRFTDLSSIPGQGKITNIPVFYHEVNMVLWVLFSNAQRVIIMHELQLCQLNYHSPAKSSAEHGLLISTELYWILDYKHIIIIIKIRYLHPENMNSTSLRMKAFLTLIREGKVSFDSKAD